MKHKLIIYDFDGVLVNSRTAVYRYYDAILKHHNLPLIDWENSELGRLAFGMTHMQLLSRYASGEKLEAMAAYVPEFTREQMLEMTPLENGVLETVPSLSEEYHLAICTNRSASVADYLNHYGLAHRFGFTITAADVQNAKPSPEGAIKIMKYFNATPENTLFIGDSEVDYLAARDAGVRFIAYGNELYSSPVINDHREMLKYLW